MIDGLGLWEWYSRILELWLLLSWPLATILVIDTTHGTPTDDELVWNLVGKTASAESGDEDWQHLLQVTFLLKELVLLSNSTVQRGSVLTMIDSLQSVSKLQTWSQCHLCEPNHWGKISGCRHKKKRFSVNSDCRSELSCLKMVAKTAGSRIYCTEELQQSVLFLGRSQGGFSFYFKPSAVD